MFDAQSRFLSWNCEQKNEPDMARSKKFRNLHKEFKLCNFIKRTESRHKVSIRMKVTFQCLNDGESSGFRFRRRFEIAKGGKSETRKTRREEKKNKLELKWFLSSPSTSECKHRKDTQLIKMNPKYPRDDRPIKLWVFFAHLSAKCLSRRWKESQRKTKAKSNEVSLGWVESGAVAFAPCAAGNLFPHAHHDS